MAGDNQVVVIGNLTDDPELRYTPNGAAVADFRVAVTPRYRDQATNEWKDGEASFFKVTAWRSLAENIAESLVRGSRVVVVGKLRQRSWEGQDGERRSAVEIVADEIGPSLRWATAKIEKQTRSGGGGGDWTETVSPGAGETEEAPVEA